MARVEALDAPLRTEADCDRVRGDGVGKDNVEKLKEVVRTGDVPAQRDTRKGPPPPGHQASEAAVVLGRTPADAVRVQKALVVVAELLTHSAGMLASPPSAICLPAAASPLCQCKLK